MPKPEALQIGPGVRGVVAAVLARRLVENSEVRERAYRELGGAGVEVAATAYEEVLADLPVIERSEPDPPIPASLVKPPLRGIPVLRPVNPVD